MKVELKVNIGGASDVTFFKKGDDEQTELVGLVSAMMNQAYKTPEGIRLGKEFKDQGEKLDGTNISIKDNIAFVPTDGLQDMVRSFALNSGKSVADLMKEFMADMPELIRQGLVLELPFSVSRQEVKEISLDINPLWSVVGGKAIKGKGESYCRIVYA